MKQLLNIQFIILLLGITVISSGFEKDIFKTSKGDLAITFIGHGTLMMEFNAKVIHIDPVSRYADYTKLPKADLILITHEHGDHLDPKTIDLLKKESTEIVLTDICSEKYIGTEIMKNGDSGIFAGLKIDAVPAYNIKHMRSGGNTYHPKGNGNGYLIQFADIKVYVAGDTENIPEMKNLQNIDIVFLPMNLPYTMTPEMVADAARLINPKILYPYHFGQTDTNILVELMKNRSDIDVRIRELK